MAGAAHPEVREGLGGPPGGPGVVGRPTLRSGRGWEANPVVREGSGGPPGGPEGVQAAHPEVLDWSGGQPRSSGRVGRPTRKFGKGLEAHPEVWEAHQ